MNPILHISLVRVILPKKGIVYSLDVLREKILFSYPDSMSFFQEATGQVIGVRGPRYVDLGIDLTGWSDPQSFLSVFRFRKEARLIVGRNIGFWRKRFYDRVFDENQLYVPKDSPEWEIQAQMGVLRLAGIDEGSEKKSVND